jgi:hypothetical protein
MTADVPQNPVERSLTFFDGERFVREVTLHGLSVDDLRRIIGPAANPTDPLFYDCYPVGPAQLAELAKYAHEPLPETGPGWHVLVEASEA